ncbi:hypothetical protein HPB48_007338 [Haemaphysalis longicornis]|uniref:Uncharacterized protein n=1 Tax=Haemaphysalis longicornis TaxID=44386 RepID=A0A9J6GLP7_HAELO|nr:hypothetical protein HPB48_007338 [Haemaphysalis longicornis]
MKLRQIQAQTSIRSKSSPEPSCDASGKPNPAVGLTAESTATKPSLTPKFAPWPAPLPRDDYKLVLRPQGGLKIAEFDLAEVSLALLSAIQSTWRQTNL